eukprot:TRINITY_DN29591_c0_g2_i1.p1 TRINITY_DN29591_c0_g2~~TRINITY_DN29591_c0_g2_i1.p1  ORF type:complete len:250 (+),score=47.83 TRINITY_DN29591_c0_g2_i1:80-829(+)
MVAQAQSLVATAAMMYFAFARRNNLSPGQRPYVPKVSGLVIVVDGTSAAGKDTLLNQVFSDEHLSQKLVKVTRCTTRSQREGEVNGTDYHFLTEERVKELMAEGAFYDIEEVPFSSGVRHYGVLASDVQKVVDSNKVALVIGMSLEGHTKKELALHKYGWSQKSVFLSPPSIAELENRIRGRNRDPSAEIDDRLDMAKRILEMATTHKEAFDAFIVNNNMNDALHELKSAIYDFIEEAKSGKGPKYRKV